jgi:hypothetical protein
MSGSVVRQRGQGRQTYRQTDGRTDGRAGRKTNRETQARRADGDRWGLRHRQRVEEHSGARILASAGDTQGQDVAAERVPRGARPGVEQVKG